MTAVNVLVGEDRVSIYTDTAGLGLDGTLRRFVSKTRELPGMRCVIAIRGEVRALDALAKLLPTLARNYDELRAAAGDGRLKAALSRWRSLLRGRIGLLVPFDLVIAGMSATGPKAFIVCINRHMYFDGKGTKLKAQRPFDVPRATIMPTVPLSPRMRENPGASMPAILDLQHQHREPSRLIPGGVVMVGGSVTCTTITADGIRSGEVMRWPDKIGEPIGGGKAYRKARWRLAFLVAAAAFGPWATFVLGEVAYLLIVGGSATP